MRLGMTLLAALLVVTPASARDKAYMLITPTGTITNGSGIDVEEIKAIKAAYGHDVFWFRSAGKDYLVRDAAIVKQIGELFRPQMELGAEQSALGVKQSALGVKQSALGVEQSRLGVKQARTRDEAEQSELSQRQAELGRQQSELGRQQAELGRQQSELGRRQEQLSHEIDKKLSPLVDDLIRRGLARELH